MSWWQILLGIYIICCLAMIVWYFRSIHGQYQTDRTFFDIMSKEDWDLLD